ncbi:alpha/beta hydrolase [Saccharopolyspora sp. K220]|uniref:alpha/beta fold hydrolase n=1 Tax=Saccharopolyspora soli TaxID=2926618 RepID=UPI001F55C588|nr:alpha/beta hydrolase [Saccharopolyspora soli]MCI2418253.1 alpha/beta hydrolase [Saccharopolyspora soli]
MTTTASVNCAAAGSGRSTWAATSLPEDLLDDVVRRTGSHLAPGARAQIVLARTIDVEADLLTISAPTLVISGLADNFVDPAHSEHAAEAIPGAVLLELDGGHGLPHEQTGPVVAAITDLIGRTA